MDRNLKENLHLNDTARLRIIFEFTISTFLSQPSNFSSSRSSLSLLITLTICIIDPKILSFDSIFTIAWWCQKFRFASGCMFAIRTGILHLIWVQSISVLREYKDTLQNFHLKDHISKIVDIDILYIYLQTIRNCWVKPILNIMVQAAFGPFFVTVPGHWAPTSRWRKKSHTGDRYHIEKATMNFFENNFSWDRVSVNDSLLTGWMVW